MIKVGIIGCGGVAERHIIPIRRLTGVEIVGVADIDEEKGREIAHRCGIQYVYRDAAAMLRERPPDVVHVLTPPQSHKEMSIQAMEAGCHVFVEKPMALNVKEADEMIAASRHHRVTLGICHNTLFDPAVMEAKELVTRGAIGKVVGVETFWRVFEGIQSSRYQKTQWLYELPGGIFHEVCPHPVYLHMEFLKVLQVDSAISKQIGSDLPMPPIDLCVLFAGESGFGYMSLSTTTSPKIRILTVRGTDMTIHVNMANNTLVKFRRDGFGGKVPKALENLDHILQLLSKTITNTLGTLRGRRTTGHGVLIEKFYESIRKGVDPPVTGEDGRAVVAVLDQIWAKLDKTHARGEAS